MSDSLETLSGRIVSMNDMYEDVPVDSVAVLTEDLRQVEEAGLEIV